MEFSMTQVRPLSSLSYLCSLFLFFAAHHYTPILSGADPVLQVAFFMIVACEIVLGVSRRGCNFLLNMVQYIINLTILRAGPHISQSDQKLLSDIPVDFRRAEEQFHLAPKCTIVAVCPDPDCHATYEPTFIGDSTGGHHFYHIFVAFAMGPISTVPMFLIRQLS
jgi:hypothetical protein